MSTRTSARVKKPSTRLLEIEESELPQSPAAESSTSGRRGAKGSAKDEPHSATAASANGKGKQKKDEEKPKRGKGKKKEEEEEGEHVAQENGDEAEDEGADDEDPDKVYCLCKKPGTGQMIECENCHDWFHFRCIKMTKARTELIHEYICPNCTEESGGKLHTIFTSDLSNPASTPRSETPEKPAKAIKGGGARKAKGVSPAPTTEKKTKGTGKGGKGAKAAAGGRGSRSRGKAEDGDEEAGRSSRIKDETEEESDDDSGEDDGSDYGDAASKDKAKEESEDEGERSDGSTGKGSDADGASSKGAKPTRGARRLSEKKRKPSETNLKRQPPSKQRKISTSAGPSNSKPSDPHYQTWSAVREFSLKKLQAALKVVVILHRKLQAESKLKQEAHSADEDSAAVPMDVDEEAPVDEDLATSDANAYGKALESAMFERTKEHSDKTGTFTAGQRYKQQYNIILTALEQDLRPDLREGISTAELKPEVMAAMTSRDLERAEEVERRRKHEAESLKATIRLEDANGPLRYNKKTLEDAEQLQKIENQIAHTVAARAVSQPVQAAGSEEPSEAMDIDEDDDKATPKAAQETDGSDEAPALPEAPSSPIKATAPVEPRQSSLSAALQRDEDSGRGDLSKEMAGDGEDKQEYDLPDFGQGIDGVENNHTGSDGDDYFTGEKPKEVVGSDLGVQGILRGLPIVWTGEILNPAQPDLKPPVVDARQVGGTDLATQPQLWNIFFNQSPIELVGRVGTSASAKYLAGSRASSQKDMFVVAFTPGKMGTKEEAVERQRFKDLVDFHVSRDRHGVVKPYGALAPPGCPQELYLVPMSPAQKFEFTEAMDRFLLPKERNEDVLLGVFIVSKGREPPPAPVAAAPVAPPVVPTTTDIKALLASLNPGIIASAAAPGGSPLPGLPGLVGSPFAPTPTSGLPSGSPGSSQGPPMPRPTPMPVPTHQRVPSYGPPPPVPGLLPPGMVFLPPPPGLQHSAPPMPPMPPMHMQGRPASHPSGVPPQPTRNGPPVYPSRMGNMSPTEQQQAGFNNNAGMHRSPPMTYSHPRAPGGPSGGQGYQPDGQRSPGREYGYGRDGQGQGQRGPGNVGRGGGRR